MVTNKISSLHQICSTKLHCTQANNRSVVDILVFILVIGALALVPKIISSHQHLQAKIHQIVGNKDTVSIKTEHYQPSQFYRFWCLNIDVTILLMCVSFDHLNTEVTKTAKSCALWEQRTHTLVNKYNVGKNLQSQRYIKQWSLRTQTSTLISELDTLLN